MMSIGQEKDRNALLKSIANYLQDRQYSEDDLGGDYCPECDALINKPHERSCLCRALSDLLDEFGNGEES